MNKVFDNLHSFIPSKVRLELRIVDSQAGGFEPPPTKGKGSSSTSKTAANISLLTSTGGVVGLLPFLIVPFFDNRTGKFIFAKYDSADFNCEEDCIYNFRQEDLQTGRNIDVSKIYIQYRDIGEVKFDVIVTATLYNRKTKKSKIVHDELENIVVGNKKPTKKIYSLFVDLKVTGERPQLSIVRKKDAGPLSIIKAMMIGDSSEEDQV